MKLQSYSPRQIIGRRVVSNRFPSPHFGLKNLRNRASEKFTVPIELVRLLRAETNVGIVKCQKALEEARGNFDEARKILIAKGTIQAGKLGDKAANEGRIQSYVSSDGRLGVMVEVHAQTDFVFQPGGHAVPFISGLVETLKAHPVPTIDELLSKPFAGKAGQTVEEARKALVAVVGENIVIKNLARFEAGPRGLVVSYVHHDGKKAALVELGFSGNMTRHRADLQDAGLKLGMQIVSTRPIALTRDQIPSEIVEQARSMVEVEVKRDYEEKEASGKTLPPNFRETLTTGKWNRWYAEHVLLEQEAVVELKGKDQNHKRIDVILSAAGQKLGGRKGVLEIRRFALMHVG